MFERLRGLPMLQLPAQAIAFLIGVELLAVALPAYSLASEPLHAGSCVRLFAIGVVAIGYSEACDRVERFRRYLGADGIRANHFSVWSVAAMLVAPAGAACALIFVLYAHAAAIGRRHHSVRLHRLILTAAATALATWTASEVAEGVFAGEFPANDVNGAYSTITAISVLIFLDMALVGAAMMFASGRYRIRQVLPDREATTFELSTQILGIIAAQLLVRSPWLAPATVGFLVAMHRSSLVKQLQVAAVTDPKTGLLNAAAWRERALETMRRAVREEQRVALIVIDLDHFKRVNDKYGHLVGDQVLHTIGGLLRRESRAHDLVGRFGGEEFFILIDGRTAAAHAVDMATRLRARIAALEFPLGMRVTASLGVAHRVPASADLDGLVAAADAALYEAKAGGRDRVHAVVAAT